MAWLKRLGATAGMVAAAGLAACGGSGPGLSVLVEENTGFSLACGDTASWEAGVVANVGKEAAVVRSVKLAADQEGFSLDWARAYEGRSNAIDESRPTAELVGLRVPSLGSSLAELRDASANANGWHLVVGIKTSACPFKVGGELGICATPRGYSCRAPRP